MHTRRFLISLFLMTSLVLHSTHHHHHMHFLLQTMIKVRKAHMIRLGTHVSQPLALWMSVVWPGSTDLAMYTARPQVWWGQLARCSLELVLTPASY